MSRLARIMTEPLEELNRFQRTVRFSYNLIRYGARQLQEGRAAQMAAALSFRVLFGLMPVLVVGTVLVRALLGPDDFKRFVPEVFEWAGLYNYKITLTWTDAAEARRLVSIGEFLEQLISQASTLNVAAVGWMGLALLVYAAIGLMMTIENSFNSIYRAPQGRSWTRRLPLHWFVLTVGPAGLGLTAYIDKLFLRWIGSTGIDNWLIRAAPLVWGFVASWLFLFAIFKLVPNTHVARRSALAGAFVSAVLLEIGRRTLGAYLGHALSVQQLYGSLGLIPLFMFWIYLMWLFVLFGLQVSAILQMLGGRELEELQGEPHHVGLVDPAAVLLVMQVVARNFQSARPTTSREIAEGTAVPEATLVRMVDELVIAGVLHRLDREDGAVTLARPPDQISADELIDIGYRMVDEGAAGRHSVIIQKLRDAQRKLAGQMTLARLATLGAEQPT